MAASFRCRPGVAVKPDCEDCLTALLHQLIMSASHLVPHIGSSSVSAELSELGIPTRECSCEGRQARNSIVVGGTVLCTTLRGNVG